MSGLVFVAAGVPVGILVRWMTRHKPQRERITDFIFAAIAVVVGIFIALGFTDRWDSLWAFMTAVLLLSRAGR